MQPAYIRIVLPPNKDLRLNTAPQNATHFKALHPTIHGQNNVSSLQLLNGISPTTGATPTRLIITSPPSTFNLSKEIMVQKTNNLTTVVPETPVGLSSSSVDISTIKLNNIHIIPPTDIGKCISFKNFVTIY
jgi:hypothetical protein